MTAAYRLHLGGPGLVVGIGIGIIVLASGIGIIVYFLRKQRGLELGWATLAVLSIVVHLVLLACLPILPGSIRWQVFREFGIPMLLLFPLAGILFGRLLLSAENAARLVREPADTQSRLVDAQANAHIEHRRLESQTRIAFRADEIYRILCITPDSPADLKILGQFVHPDDWQAFHVASVLGPARHRPSPTVSRAATGLRDSPD